MPRAEIVANKGTDALHYAVDCKVKEGLQLVIHAENKHICLGKHG